MGNASILASLVSNKILVKNITIAVNNDDFNIKKLTEEIIIEIQKSELSGDDCYVCVGVYIWNEEYIHALTRQVKQKTNASIVLGGPQVSYAQQGELESAYPGVDFFIRGYGEKALISVIRGQHENFSGVHQAGQPDKELQADHQLEDLPSPYLTGSLPIVSSIHWETQRGCPYACEFCQHKSADNRHKVKTFSYERLEEEARLFAQANVKRISVLDPIFHHSEKHSLRVLQILKDAGVKAEISLQCRLEMLTDDFLDALDGLKVDLEFGLQTAIRSESLLIRRGNNMKVAAQKLKRLKLRQIPFEISLIYGLPSQTLVSFKHSIDWCHQHGVTRIKAWPLMLLRGTALYSKKEEFGFVESDEAIPRVIQSNTCSRAENQKMAELANQLNLGQLDPTYMLAHHYREENHAIFYRA
ncbi:MAG: B12-binding domain-containing radical SAM protein [Oceanobacter sp.]